MKKNTSKWFEVSQIPYKKLNNFVLMGIAGGLLMLLNPAFAQELAGGLTEGNFNTVLYQSIDNQILFDKEIKQLTMYTTSSPTNNLAAGIVMGNGHDRQELGVQLEAGAKITIKQVNPKFLGNLTLRLLADSSDKEGSISFGVKEVTLEAKFLVVPFVDTPYTQANQEAPVVEFSIEGSSKELPVFTKGTENTAFEDRWNQFNGFGLIKSEKFLTLLPYRDKMVTLKTGPEKVIDLYDNQIIGYYNELVGLSDNDPNPLNRSSKRRYFYKADAKGGGYMYYGGLWAAQSSLSAFEYLADGWGALHETGHGYQGAFMNRGLATSEVWNNLYGVLYQYKKMGKTQADQKGWLYGYGHKETIEKSMKEALVTQKTYESLGLREKLIILSNLLDKASDDGMRNFYQSYRELASDSGFNAANYPLPDLLMKYWGEPNRYDFHPILHSWGIDVSAETRQSIQGLQYEPVAHLTQVVPEDMLGEAVTALTQENRLSSVLSLVTNNDLKPFDLKSNVTLKLINSERFKHNKDVLKIYNGSVLYKEVPIESETIILSDIPNGVYSLNVGELGYIENPYLFVKTSEEQEMDFINYEDEAEESVNQLLIDIPNEKIKPTIMVKDLDQPKKLIKSLAAGEFRTKLEEKLARISASLQEITFAGLSNRRFATVNVNRGTAMIRTISGVPHSYFNGTYASINISRDEKTIYENIYVGSTNYVGKEETIPLEEGDKVTLTHRETSRYLVNHNDLLTVPNDNTYDYVVRQGLLEADYEGEAIKAVNQLFEEGNTEKIRTTIMQKDLDQVQKKINLLPSSSLKSTLEETLKDVSKSLQEITLQGLSNWNFASITVIHGKATIRTFSGVPHHYFSNIYGSIQIDREGKQVYKKVYNGSQHYVAETETISFVDGDHVSFVHQEASRFKVNQDLLVTTPVNKTYDFIVQKGELVSKGQEGLATITSFDTYEEGSSTFINGEFRGVDVKYMRPEVNGVKKTLIMSASLARGGFSYYLPGLKETDIVEFVLFDMNYREVGRKQVVVKKIERVRIPSFDEYTEGLSSFVKGVFVGEGVKYVRPEVNGIKKALTMLNSNAILEKKVIYYLPNLKVTDKVELVLFNKNYAELGREIVAVKKIAQAEIINVEPYIEKQTSFIKGIYIGAIASYMRPEVNGEKQLLISSAMLLKGEFSYYLPSLKATDQVEFVLFNTHYHEIARIKLTIG